MGVETYRREASGLLAAGDYELDAHGVHVAVAGTPGPEAPALYWPMASGHGDTAAGLATRMAAQTSLPFTLVACEVNEWDHELSPWPAGDVTGDDDFTGEAPAYLGWLLDRVVPLVEGEAHPARAVGGYSMAGLFAAWAFLSCDAFAGMASGSGSLWFPGWREWARERRASAGSVAYLSLGTKEPRVRNRQVATVGEATQELADALAADPGVRASAFEWNPGGHFTDPTGRMAAGFSWLVDRL